MKVNPMAKTNSGMFVEIWEESAEKGKQRRFVPSVDANEMFAVGSAVRYAGQDGGQAPAPSKPRLEPSIASLGGKPGVIEDSEAAVDPATLSDEQLMEIATSLKIKDVDKLPREQLLAAILQAQG